MSSLCTMEDWPRLINDIKDLPEFFKRSFMSVVNKNDLMPYTVYYPQKSNNKPKLISYFDEKTHIFEPHNYSVRISSFSSSEIINIEKGVLLLNSWMKVSGISRGGLITIRIMFNSVNEYLTDFFIDKLRNGIYIENDIKFHSEKFKLLFLKDHNFKLVNYSIESLKENFEIKTVIYQKNIPANHFVLNTKIFTSFSMILTEYEIIVVKDGFSEYVSATKMEHYSNLFQLTKSLL